MEATLDSSDLSPLWRERSDTFPLRWPPLAELPDPSIALAHQRVRPHRPKSHGRQRRIGQSEHDTCRLDHAGSASTHDLVQRSRRSVL